MQARAPTLAANHSMPGLQQAVKEHAVSLYIRFLSPHALSSAPVVYKHAISIHSLVRGRFSSAFLPPPRSRWQRVEEPEVASASVGETVFVVAQIIEPEAPPHDAISPNNGLALSRAGQDGRSRRAAAVAPLVVQLPRGHGARETKRLGEHRPADTPSQLVCPDSESFAPSLQSG